MEKSKNIIQEKSFNFALEIVHLYKIMIDQNEYVVSKQLLRSGTSIGANVEEAIGAQSRKDFINKMSVAYKEARETRYWIKLLIGSKMVEIDLVKHLDSVEELNKILSSIIKSTKETQSFT